MIQKNGKDCWNEATATFERSLEKVCGHHRFKKVWGTITVGPSLNVYSLQVQENYKEKNVKMSQFPTNLKAETLESSKKTHPGSDFRPPTVKIDVPSNVPVGRKHLVILPWCCSLHVAFNREPRVKNTVRPDMTAAKCT